MSKIQQVVSSFLSQYSTPSATMVIGVSGGADSMVLMDVLHELGASIIVVHYNFMLRGEEADLDQTLVEDYCKQKSIQCFVKKENAQENAEGQKLSIQEAAREMRYSFFKEIKHKQGAEKIVTAHHADDQVETILLNLFRGSGLVGLAGMPIAANDILRPLISISKEEIYRYAEEHKVPFREDTSNETDKYQRNYLRNKLIPLLASKFPAVKENILNTATHLAEANLIYSQRIEQIKAKLLEQQQPGQWRVPIRKLTTYEPQQTILFELFKNFGFDRKQLPELLKLISANNGARLESKQCTVFKDRNFLLIQRNEEKVKLDFFIESAKGRFDLSGGTFTWELVEKAIDRVKYDKNIATLDAKEITLPLKLRAPREGDYFYPLGMNKKKKLSRYFIDNKFSPQAKEQAMVLEMIPKEGANKKRILWLVGERIDNRFRISPTTKSFYRFAFTPNE